VENDLDIPSYSYTPDLVDVNSPATPDSFEYVIITIDSLAPYFDTFVDWMNKKGIRTIVTLVDSIRADYPYGDTISDPAIDDTAGSIRSYLRHAHADCGTAYALLGGSLVPIHPFTDLYFSDLDGDWNFSGGGQPDYCHLDLWVGRLPCLNGEDILNWTEKVLNYEQNPGNGSFAYLTKSYCNQADYQQNWERCQHQNSLFPTYFDTQTVEEYPGPRDPDPTEPWGDSVIQDMNDPRGFITWQHHGKPQVVGILTKTHVPYYPSQWKSVITTYDTSTLSPNGGDEESPGNGLDNLSNKSKYSVLFSTDCDVANYISAHDSNTRSLPEGFLFFKERGGVAFLGAYASLQNVWYDSCRIEQWFFKTLFPRSPQSPIFQVGVCEAVARKKSSFGVRILPRLRNITS
jgi:hypothetical protein